MDFYSPAALLSLALIMFVAGVVQAAVGFAGGLFAIPLFVLLGMELPQAVMIALIGSFIQSVMGAYQLRRELDPRATIRPALLRLVTMPLGVATLWQLNQLEATRVKQFIGVMLLAIVVSQRVWRVRPRAKLHPAWEYLALGLSGFMAGLCGMGGPAMILWVMAHDWTAKKSRAFMFFVFSAGMIPQGLMLWYQFGELVHAPAIVGTLGVFITMLGTQLGLQIGHGFSKSRLRAIVFTLLIFIALSAMLSPYTADHQPTAVRQVKPPPAKNSGTRPPRRIHACEARRCARHLLDRRAPGDLVPSAEPLPAAARAVVELYRLR